jgi:hypothetical protein
VPLGRRSGLLSCRDAPATGIRGWYARVMRTMSQEEQAWIEGAARGFDALVFWTVGRYGAQPLLLPRRLWAPRRRRTRPDQQRTA